MTAREAAALRLRLGHHLPGQVPHPRDTAARQPSDDERLRAMLEEQAAILARRE